MGADIDFCTLTVEEVAEFLVANVAEFGDPGTVETLAVDNIVGVINAGLAVVVAERNAVAIVLSEIDHVQKCNPVLWLLYVDPASRSQGLGAAFVAEIRRRFEKKLPMVLVRLRYTHLRVVRMRIIRKSWRAHAVFEVYPSVASRRP